MVDEIEFIYLVNRDLKNGGNCKFAFAYELDAIKCVERLHTLYPEDTVSYKAYLLRKDYK